MRRWAALSLLLPVPTIAGPMIAVPMIAMPALAETGAPPPDPAAHAAAERRAALDEALAELRAARTEEEAAPLEAKVRQMWLQAGSPAVTLLLGRGIRALQGAAPTEASQDFEAALVLDPDHVEAWHQLAEARYAMGDTHGALAAISEVLRREPRHFVALQTLAHIAEAREDWKAAYAAWREVMEIVPKLPGGDARLRDLKRRALGEEM